MLAPSAAVTATATAPVGGNGHAEAIAPRRDWAALFVQDAREERRLSARTIEAYAIDLGLASRWATDQHMDLAGLTTADLRRFFVERAREGVLPSTIARHLSSFRGFYSFLHRHGVITTNPAMAVAAPRVARRQPSLLGVDIMASLLQPPGHRRSEFSAYRARRDHAIVCMLYGTNLGVSQVRLLRWQQVDTDRQVIWIAPVNAVQRSPGLDDTLLPVLTSLREFVSKAGLDWTESPYCFPTTSGLPMTRQALCYAVRKWGSEHGEDLCLTPSLLRRTGRAHLTR